MKKFIYVEKGRSVEAENRREFVLKMSEAGFFCERYISEKEAECSNPLYEFSWKVGCPVFESVCGPMNDMGTMRYESWEVYNVLST